MVKRIYVAKQAQWAEADRKLAREWREEVGIRGLTSVRVWQRYDVEGIPDEWMAAAIETVFAEPPVDEVQTELPVPPGARVLAVELLPGQYDQRADSAQQCVRLLAPEAAEAVRVAHATVYVVEGEMSPTEWTLLQGYVINPIESREADMALPDTLEAVYPQPAAVPVLEGLTTASKTELVALATDLGLAMELADLGCVQAYFRDVAKREPTLTELRVLDTYWSDHCRHTTFGTKLTHVDIEKGHFTKPIQDAYDWYQETRKTVFGTRTERPESLMDMATLAVRALRREGLLAELDESEEINACTIRIPVETATGVEEWLLLFKNETHNHPTEIEPFGGAATCLGGCIRDPLSGRAYVYQAMRVTGSGDPRQPLADTWIGKLPQRKITTEAAHGYSSYGNQIGLATGEVKEYYHPGFMAKRMEIGAVVGAVRADQVVREVPAPGDVVLLIGGRTGRDGCGGATGSSKEHSADSLLNCGAEVQKGNAPTERKLQCLFRRPEVTKLVRRCNDFGAGGVAVAVGELADGVDICLDAVPKKYTGLDGTELAISESQERMAVVVAADAVARMVRYAAEENLEATPIATVTETPRLVMRWRNQVIVDLQRDFLATNGAARETVAKISAPEERDYFVIPDVDKADFGGAWKAALRDLANASQQGLAERFDSTIGAGTVLMPYGGSRMRTPTVGMVAKIPLVDGETDTVSVMTHAYDPYLAEWSPFHGGLYAVLNALTKMTALGANWRKSYLTLQEYFEKMTTMSSWGKPTAALLGAFAAQMELGIGAIGGKDSMSGTFMDVSVPPTLVAFAVAPGTASEVCGQEWQAAGHALVLVETPKDEYAMPQMDRFAELADALYAERQNGTIYSMQPIGTGGMAVAAAKASFGNGIGATLSTTLTPGEWLANRPASWLVEMDIKRAEEWAYTDAAVRIVGMTGGTEMVYGTTAWSCEDLCEAWQEPLDAIFPRVAEPSSQDVGEVPLVSQRPRGYAGVKIARPKVVIPVMPGTNCEVDTARAFMRAGAVCDVIKVCNGTAVDLTASVERLATALSESQILAFPGGFSAGDEPDGSGKFIAALFRHPLLVERVHELIQQRDGLVLGICNGFQALIKLGLLPYGEVRPLGATSPTLTYNTIGRHVSGYVTTQVVSTASPWMMYCEAGELHRIVVSHGEGRFIATPDMAAQLVANGQIATRYTDPKGYPTMDPAYNPNGSLMAIEGLMAANGRILGKMGHSERVGTYIAKNIPGPKDQPIFAAGVDYFAK